jgi:CRISPR/Cas system-associated exonuclease Cas4 (RecB family)
MFQVVLMWNISHPENEMAESIKNVKYRGYDPIIALTSQFSNKITEGSIKPLAVRHIADKYCSTRRDLYYEMGSNKSFRRKGSKTWGRIAGLVSQNYLVSLFLHNLKKNNNGNYSKIVKRTDDFSLYFQKGNRSKIQELNGLGSKEYEDSSRLLQILKINGRIEIAAKVIHNLLSGGHQCMSPDDLSFEYDDRKIEFNTNPLEIGINSPATPDFFIERFKIVGDVKTGIFFDERYLLTCAGYALAYENWQKGEKRNIDWGVIYFLPTRIPTDYAKPITYAQLYVFPIDDVLRGWFLTERDKAYDIISKDSPPDFPKDRDKCEKDRCKYFENVCKKWD